MEASIEKMLISKQETARILSISEKKLWSMTYPRGPIISIQLGSRVLYSVESLRRFIQQEEAKFQTDLKLQKETSQTVASDNRDIF